MSSLIVKSAAKKLGNILVNEAVEEAKSLYKIRDKIESLQMELKWMECFLRDADNHQHQEELVSMWVSQVRDLTYDAEDTIERYLHGVSHHRRDGVRNTLKWFSCILFTCDAWTLHNLGSEIDSLTFKMNEISSRLHRYGIKFIRTTRNPEYSALTREERRTYSHTEEDVVGLDNDIRKLVDQLVTPDVKVVAISGTGGLGKTTLARKVFNHKDIKDEFKGNCVWVYISKEFERGNIFQEILLGLVKADDDDAGKKSKVLTSEELPTRIQKEKCLVVLDDIWTQKAWEDLKPAFESIGMSRSKLLLTTRTQGLLQQIDPRGYLHRLQPLSDEDSWKLLQRKAFLGHGSITESSLEITIQQFDGSSSSASSSSENSSSKKKSDLGSIESGPIIQIQSDERKQMEKLGKDMLKHCGGLPIAIIAVGGILSTKKTLSEWEDVQKNISSYLMSSMEQEGTSSGALGILELSYNELPFYLKPCFLYLGNFPEDYEISTQRLYHLWEAEGLLAIEDESKRKGGTTYDIGERYLNELVQRSMVQVRKCWASGRMKTCQVHDVMQDMCLRKCEEVSFLSHIECSTESGTVSVSPPFSVELKKLRRCALHGEDEFREAFEIGEKAIGLRSLLVFNRRCSPAEKIWKSVPLLRVLDLQRVYLYYTLYGLKHLIHLRYLSVKKSHLDELPSCLFELQYLETLDLRCDGITLRNKFFKMKRLRHLYLPGSIQVKGGKKLMFPTGGHMETIKNFDPERCETKELMQMTNLRVFSVRKGYIFDKAEELKLVLEAPVMKKGGQLINTFRVGVHEDVLIEDPLILSSAARHPSFKELRIQGPHTANDGKNGNGIIFPYSLILVELNACKAIGEGDLLSGLEKLPSLQVLNLNHSVIGGNTVSFSTGSFPSLQVLKLNDSVIGGNKVSFSSGSFPSLQVLKLNDSVIGGNKVSFSAGSFPNLREFRIISPKGSFEWEVGETTVPNLQLLELHNCKNLNKLKNIPNSLADVLLYYCGITEEDVLALEKLPHLKFLSIRGNVGYKLSFSPDSFPQLTRLNLLSQTELKEWEVGEGALPNLQSLYLERWDKVNNYKLPHSLTQVELKGCEIGEGDDSLCGCLEKLPHLQLLCLDNDSLHGGGGGNKIMRFSPGSFPQLTELSLIQQTNLEEWEVGDDALSNLQLLELHACHKLKKLNKLPDSLTQVVCRIEEEGGGSLLHCLEELPRLRILKVYGFKVPGGGSVMRFSPGSFTQLTKLSLSESIECNKEWEWEVGEKALSSLQHLDFDGCKMLKKLPQGLPDSVHIECRDPCIKGIEKYNTCPRSRSRSNRIILRLPRRVLKPLRFLEC